MCMGIGMPVSILLVSYLYFFYIIPIQPELIYMIFNNIKYVLRSFIEHTFPGLVHILKSLPIRSVLSGFEKIYYSYYNKFDYEFRTYKYLYKFNAMKNRDNIALISSTSHNNTFM